MQSVPHCFLFLIIGSACAAGGYGHFPEALLIVYFWMCMIIFALSVAWLLSALTVIARDVQQMLPAILNVWFWLTPVAWSSDRLAPPARTLLAFNPASYIVSGYRYALMPKVFAAPSPFETAAFWTMTVTIFVIGASSFRRLRPYFWDCL